MKEGNEVKHTPSPWTFQNFGESEPDGRDFITIEHQGCPLCEVRGTDDMSCIEEDDEPKIAAEMVANARLICAAPELLEACNKALHRLQFLDLCEDIREELRSAIQKATGSPTPPKVV